MEGKYEAGDANAPATSKPHAVTAAAHVPQHGDAPASQPHEEADPMSNGEAAATRAVDSPAMQANGEQGHGVQPHGSTLPSPYSNALAAITLVARMAAGAQGTTPSAAPLGQIPAAAAAAAAVPVVTLPMGLDPSSHAAVQPVQQLNGSTPNLLAGDQQTREASKGRGKEKGKGASGRARPQSKGKKAKGRRQSASEDGGSEGGEGDDEGGAGGEVGEEEEEEHVRQLPKRRAKVAASLAWGKGACVQQLAGRATAACAVFLAFCCERILHQGCMVAAWTVSRAVSVVVLFAVLRIKQQTWPITSPHAPHMHSTPTQVMHVCMSPAAAHLPAAPPGVKLQPLPLPLPLPKPSAALASPTTHKALTPQKGKGMAVPALPHARTSVDCDQTGH